MSATPAVTERGGTRRQSERGAALVFALFGLATLTILGLGLTSLGIVGTKMTTNEKDTQEALALADAGLAHARKLITYTEWDWQNLTPFLVSGNGTACDGDELAQAPTPPAGLSPIPVGYPTLFINPAAAGGNALGTGTYQVYVCDDDLTDLNSVPVPPALDPDDDFDANRRIIVRSIGTTASGATATLEQVLGASTAPAVLINGDVAAGGNVEVHGNNGIIHSNGDMDVIGTSVCAQQYFQATGGVTGNPDGGANCNQPGETRPGSAPINVRVMDPYNYRWRAKYWLTTTTVAPITPRILVNYDPTGIADSDSDFQLPDATHPAPTGWTWTNNYSWFTNDAAVTKGIYYATTNVDIGGNVNSICTAPAPAAPDSMRMTILTMGWLTTQGGAKMCGALSVQGVGRITVMAGTDIKLTGNTGGVNTGVAMFEGLYYARHQVGTGGTPVIYGQVVALNLADTQFPLAPIAGVVNNPDNPVQLDNQGRMSFNGNGYINFNSGGMTTTAPLSWRECRADPANLNPGNADDACGALWGGTN